MRKKGRRVEMYRLLNRCFGRSISLILCAILTGWPGRVVASGEESGLVWVAVRHNDGLMTAASAVLISLHLTDRWSLEAQSGEYSAMDLLYRYR